MKCGWLCYGIIDYDRKVKKFRGNRPSTTPCLIECSNTIIETFRNKLTEYFLIVKYCLLWLLNRMEIINNTNLSNDIFQWNRWKYLLDGRC